MSLGCKHRRTPDPSPPKTLDEAVQFVIDTVPAEELERLRRIPEAEVGPETRVWQMALREKLGLWGRNRELIDSLPAEHRWADNASHLIVMTLWKRLNATDD